MIMIKLALVLLFGVITAVNCLVTIETTPVLPENVLATDFSGLILRAHFPKGKHLECRWNLVGKYSVTIFSKSKPCSNLTNENPVCGQKKINESTYIFTEYIIKNPITESLNISVACTKGYVTATRQISVTGKPQVLLFLKIDLFSKLQNKRLKKSFAVMIAVCYLRSLRTFHFIYERSIANSTTFIQKFSILKDNIIEYSNILIEVMTSKQ